MYIYRYTYTYTYIVPICITYTYIVPICIVPSCILTHLYANPTHIVLLLYLAPDFPIYSRFTQPNIIFKLRILFQNSSTIFTFRRPSVDKGDIPPSLHYMTFYTTQTIYFLKAYDQTKPDHVFISYSSIAH